MINHKYFVTGTGTEVGKTVISSVLACNLRAHYYKPIQAGPDLDTDFARRVLQDDCLVLGEEVRFPLPIAPCQQHSCTRQVCEVLQAIQAAKDKVSCSHSMIIEGAGGIFTPLCDANALTMLDFMKVLACPIVLVAHSGLGTVNHTLLSIMALRHAGLDIKEIVLNGPLHSSNAATIMRYASLEKHMLSKFPPIDIADISNLRHVAFEGKLLQCMVRA